MKYLVVVALFTFLLNTSCIQKQNADTKVLKIGLLRGPSALSLLQLMDSLNYIDSTKIDYFIADDPIQLRPQLIQNQIHIAVVPTVMAAMLYNKGTGYRIAAVPVWGSMYLLSSDTTIKTWEHLKNKTIHSMAKGMTPDVALQYLAKFNGVDPQKDFNINYTYGSHPELASMLASGKIETAIMSEPMMSMVMKKNPKLRIVFDIENEWKKATGNQTAFAQTAVIVDSAFYIQHPNIVRSFLKSYEKSLQSITTNHYKIALLAVKNNLLPDTISSNSSLSRIKIKYVSARDAKYDVIRFLEVFMTFNPEIIGGKLPGDAIFLQDF